MREVSASFPPGRCPGLSYAAPPGLRASNGMSRCREPSGTGSARRTYLIPLQPLSPLKLMPMGASPGHPRREGSRRRGSRQRDPPRDKLRASPGRFAAPALPASGHPIDAETAVARDAPVDDARQRGDPVQRVSGAVARSGDRAGRRRSSAAAPCAGDGRECRRGAAGLFQKSVRKCPNPCPVFSADSD
jgi:hypothetical protein